MNTLQDIVVTELNSKSIVTNIRVLYYLLHRFMDPRGTEHSPFEQGSLGRQYGQRRRGGKQRALPQGGNYRNREERKRYDDRTSARAHPLLLHQANSHNVHDRRGRMTSIHYLTRDDIQDLARSDSATVISCINQNEAGFLAAFKSEKFCKNPVTLKCLIRILNTLVSADISEAQLSSRLLAQVFSTTGDFSQFLFQLDQLIKGMVIEQRPHVRRDDIRCLSYLVKIGMFGIQRVPKSILHTFPRHSIKDAVDQLNDKDPTLVNVRQTVDELNDQFKSFLGELKPKVTQSPEQIKPEPEEPPEHYTEISILPTSQEIHPTSRKPFLRANITSGRYRNWDHYIDVQFRLLREDFVGPLRAGISKHCDIDSKLSGDIRVYHQVTIEQPVCLASGVGFEVQFNPSQFSRVNWEYTNRLIGGSLLCLSQDKFETVAFATIAQRDPKELKEGRVVIKFENAIRDFSVNLRSVYTMVESVAYFEAYRHVLERLQNLTTQNEFDTLPFRPYIVNCIFSEISKPSYLRCLAQPSFDLQEIMKSKQQKVPLFNPSAWPDAEETCLDQSQLEALQASLTQDLSVIQGPPGTGKTFIGIKIVQAFLTNRELWDPLKESPVLVVCYTNHALDQFLEGIQQTSIHGRQPDVTRIGGRSRSELLSNCFLYTKVQKAKEERSLPKRLHMKHARARNYMGQQKEEMIRNMKSIGLAKKQILSIYLLKDVMMEHHFFQLYDVVQSEYAVETWLGLLSPHSTKPSHHVPGSIPVEHSEQSQTETQSDVDEEIYDSDNEAQMIEDERLLDDYEVLYKVNDVPSPPQRDDTNEDNDEWEVVKMNTKKKQKLIEKQLSKGLKTMSTEEASGVRDLWLLRMNQRWKLYRHWKDNYVQHITQQLVRTSHSYNAACEELTEAKREIESYVVHNSDIIGMTTTGAAKHNHILKSVHPRVVVVEEAAEIFEPHILTSLSTSVQQLVLIGDHKQLRPKPNFYELEKKFDFSVSLFERLVMNNCPVVTLNIQHRMRPEIASLITPSIYAELHNHISVKQYNAIQGVGKNLFFVHHSHPETSGKDDRSHSNRFEANFLIALCDYLLKQGYQPNEITILTTYRGQLLLLKQIVKRTKNIQGVRIAVVDDFQGEENDIILLSLVRSNSDGMIGFLHAENRVCVSLSRAKKGFYAIGNFSMLEDKRSTIWPEIISHVTAQKCIGEVLPLYCQQHPDQTVEAKLPEDFHKCPEGGCQKKCDTRLTCGHVCKRLCHPYDREHIKFNCFEKCSKVLRCGHTCRYKCYECSLSCPPCSVLVQRILPSCGHSQNVQCSAHPSSIECSQLCSTALKCGHLCQNACSKPCTKKCIVHVKKSLDCDHITTVPCYLTTDSLICSVPCISNLECGHSCPGSCGACHVGRLHVKCVSKCERPLICGHLCDYPCTPSCPPCMKPCTNFCNHSRCPKKCFQPCTPCMESCEWSCQHFKCTQPCGKQCNRPPCNYPCRKRLACGHECIGLCGEVCPKECRFCDKEKVSEILFGNEDEPDARFILLPDCGHIVEVNGLDNWMTKSAADVTTEDGAGSNPHEINLKTCPRCKTPVRKCHRYGNQIKDYLQDVEMIKQKQIEALPSIDLHTELKHVKQALLASPNSQFIAEELEIVEKTISKQDNFVSSKESVFKLLFPHFVKSQLEIILQVLRIMDILSKLPTPPVHCAKDIQIVKKNLGHLKAFVSQEFISQQQISDAEAEGFRLLLLAKVIDFKCKVYIKTCNLATDEENTVNSMLLQLHQQTLSKAAQVSEAAVTDLLTTLGRKYNVHGLTKEERIEIVNAVGLRQGHWFKCPNGHYYCIGECGGAMQTAVCPECGSSIGGTNHTLVGGNQLAPEMDGATHAAWSDTANMLNFDPAELALL